MRRRALAGAASLGLGVAASRLAGRCARRWPADSAHSATHAWSATQSALTFSLAAGVARLHRSADRAVYNILRTLQY